MRWTIILLSFLCAILVESVSLQQDSQPFKGIPDLFSVRENLRLRNELEKPIYFWESTNPIDANQFTDDETLTYRLPNNSFPIRYDLWLKTDVDKIDFNFSGRVNIQIRIVQSTSVITLHHRQLTIDQIDLWDAASNKIKDKLDFTYDSAFEFLKVSLPEEFAAQVNLTLDISYHGELRNDRAGFYRASYKNEAGADVWFATTQFESTDARHAFPCYDEPGTRAIYGVQIQHDKSYKAISNMPITSRTSLDGTDYVTSKFIDTPSMQSYLLAFIVSDLAFVSNNNTDVEQRVYASPQLIKDGKADFAAEVADPILRMLEDHFGVRYPLPKMDHALLSSFSGGAMENFGLITYQESNMLYKKGTDPEYMEKNIIELISHEYTHQWFGNIISPLSWQYLWLNEGFATLYSNYIPSLIYPHEDYMFRFQIYRRNYAFQIDLAERNAVPMNFYAESPSSISSKFNSISYEKASCVLRMFQNAMFVETFTKGLNYYLTDMYMKAASPKDLHRNLQRAMDEDFPTNVFDIDKVMSTWEDQPGYPIVHVARSDSKIIFTQRRFGGGDEIYSIPISMATKVSPNFNNTSVQYLLTEPSMVLETGRAYWVIINVQMTGYYKVSYDKTSWDLIIEALNENHEVFPTFHKCELFTDMTDENTEVLDVIQALNMLSFLRNETTLNVWECAYSVEAVMSGHLYGSEMMLQYFKFTQWLVKLHLDRLGFEANEGESSSDTDMKNWVLSYSCGTLQRECLESQLEMLKESIANAEYPTSYCASIRLADEFIFDLMLNAMRTARFKFDQINSLSCSLNPQLLRKLHSLILNPANTLEFNSEHQRSVLTYTARNSVEGMEIVLDYILENHAAMDNLNASLLGLVLYDIAQLVNSEKHMTKLRAIIAVAPVGGILDIAERNLSWLSEHSKEIKEWLDERFPEDEKPEDDTTTLGASSAIATFGVVALCAMLRSLV